MSKILATSQVTIVDINDQVSINAYLNTTSPQMQLLGNNNAYTPNWVSAPVTVSAELFKMGNASNIITSSQVNTIAWSYKLATQTSFTTITSSTSGFELVGSGNKINSIKIKSNLMTKTNPGLVVRCEIGYKEIWMDQANTIKVELPYTLSTQGDNGTNGQDALTTALTNSSHNIPTDSDGNNGNYAGCATTIQIFKGSTQLTSGLTYSHAPSSGVTGTANGATYTVTNMTVDTGYIDMGVTYEGTKHVKRFNISKTRSGSGENATAYWLIASPNALAIKNNAFVPAKVSLTAMSQTGMSSASQYQGRFTIEESTDGTNYTKKYTSANNESVKDYVPSSLDIKSIRVRMYTGGATPAVLSRAVSTMLDEEVITIVKDGSNGSNGISPVSMYVWAPNGTVIHNGNAAQLSLEAKVYQGSDDRTSSATYKWEKREPNGAWVILTGTGSSINITENHIINMLTVKCSATYSGKTYTDTITLKDETDPYQVEAIPLGGNFIKNGEGGTHIYAKILQNGSEKDVVQVYANTPANGTGHNNGDIIYVKSDNKYRQLSGTSWTLIDTPNIANTKSKFNYTWFKYDKNGDMDSGFKQYGKVLFVNSAMVSEIANFVLQVEQ